MDHRRCFSRSAANSSPHKCVDVRLKQCLSVPVDYVDMLRLPGSSGLREAWHFPVQLVQLWHNLHIHCAVQDTASQPICHVMLYVMLYILQMCAVIFIWIESSFLHARLGAVIIHPRQLDQAFWIFYYGSCGLRYAQCLSGVCVFVCRVWLSFMQLRLHVLSHVIIGTVHLDLSHQLLI